MTEDLYRNLRALHQKADDGRAERVDNLTMETSGDGYSTPNSSHWNYRAFVEANDNGEDEYCIREAYYDDDGRVNGWTESPSEPHGETQEELVHDLRMMLADATQWPVVRIFEDKVVEQ